MSGLRGGTNVWYLKSGRVNFIRPCSVAIFSARGTDSSHLERTHSLSHLRGEQPMSRGFTVRGRSLDQTHGCRRTHLKRISELVQVFRL